MSSPTSPDCAFPSRRGRVRTGAALDADDAIDGQRPSLGAEDRLGGLLISTAGFILDRAVHRVDPLAMERSPAWTARHMMVDTRFATTADIARRHHDAAALPLDPLAERLDADLTDLTISGATTATILDAPQITVTGVRIPPQLHLLSESADLVTITAGGNDLGYAGSMLFTAWRHVQPDEPLTTMMAPQFAGGIPAPTPKDIDEAAAGLVEIVERVRARAPRARVLLVDYLTVIGDDTAPGPGIPFELAEITAFHTIQTALEKAYLAAAAQSGAELVAVSAISRDHGLGATEPWIAPFFPDLTATAGSFHPNAAGMAAVATHIENVARQPSPRVPDD